jgi:hypothetical protein
MGKACSKMQRQREPVDSGVPNPSLHAVLLGKWTHVECAVVPGGQHLWGEPPLNSLPRNPPEPWCKTTWDWPPVPAFSPAWWAHYLLGTSELNFQNRDGDLSPQPASLLATPSHKAQELSWLSSAPPLLPQGCQLDLQHKHQRHQVHFNSTPPTRGLPLLPLGSQWNYPVQWIMPHRSLEGMIRDQSPIRAGSRGIGEMSRVWPNLGAFHFGDKCSLEGWIFLRLDSKAHLFVCLFVCWWVDLREMEHVVLQDRREMAGLGLHLVFWLDRIWSLWLELMEFV